MADAATTMKVSVKNRDGLRRLADEDGITLDEALGKVLRRERQRRIGEQLSGGLATDEREMIRGGAAATGRLLQRDQARARR